jgi:hypothetical protein
LQLKTALLSPITVMLFRSWWVVLSDPGLLREGANVLSVVLAPAVATALRSKTLNAYRIPTMAVSTAEASLWAVSRFWAGDGLRLLQLAQQFASCGVCG